MFEENFIKNELQKNNYNDLLELSRDFKYYIDNPEKFKKIGRARLKKYAKKRPHALEDDTVDMTGGLDRENTNFGVLTQSRDIIKRIEQSKSHGYMSQRERVKLLKNLF